MDEEELLRDLYCQDGVVLCLAPAIYANFYKSSGSLFITEYTNKEKFIEWKSNDVTIESDAQDQEWAVVNAVQASERRTRTLSGSTVDSSNSRNIKVNMSEVKSFKASKKHDRLTFISGDGEDIIGFSFQHGNCFTLVCFLKTIFRTTPSKRDKSLFVIMNDDLESQKLTTSFVELQLFQDEPAFVWKFLRNLQTRPYETTMETFSKISDLVLSGADHRELENDVQEFINRSIANVENATTTTTTQEEYELIGHVPKLPPRKEYPRGSSLSAEGWTAFQDYNGRIEDADGTKLFIFRGGLQPTIRKEVWKYLLDFYPWDSTLSERQILIKRKKDEYYSMKLQWKSMSKIQEENFADYRERKSLIEKDVNRTDRTLDYYAGDDNPNLEKLYDILMTYVMYNFDLGYVQGMSDLLSPILFLMRDEVEAFWCFVGFMNKVSSNFDMDQTGMKEQLKQLHDLLAFAEPELTNYLDRHDSGNMFFCFRWLLVWLKRELDLDDVMYLWEVLWTGLPCQNFHLLICVAILETEKTVLIENNYGFTEILKHVNELSGNLNIKSMISKAEAIYHQIELAEHLNNSVRSILGLPIPEIVQESPVSSVTSGDQPCSLETVQFGPDEVAFERSLSNSYL